MHRRLQPGAQGCSVYSPLFEIDEYGEAQPGRHWEDDEKQTDQELFSFATLIVLSVIAGIVLGLLGAILFVAYLFHAL